MKLIFKYILIVVALFTWNPVFSQQTGLITGTVQNTNTGKVLSGTTITVEGLPINTLSDTLGQFRIIVPVGTYKISASNIGYITQLKYNIVVGSGNPQLVNFELQSQSNNLKEINISFSKGKSAVATDMVTPLSVQLLTTEEIKSSPGGNFDVSKVVQTLPGVGISNGVGERNDIIIRTW